MHVAKAVVITWFVSGCSLKRSNTCSALYVICKAQQCVHVSTAFSVHLCVQLSKKPVKRAKKHPPANPTHIWHHTLTHNCAAGAKETAWFQRRAITNHLDDTTPCDSGRVVGVCTLHHHLDPSTTHHEITHITHITRTSVETVGGGDRHRPRAGPAVDWHCSQQVGAAQCCAIGLQ